MTGLHRIPATTRRRPIWAAFVLGGVERLTESLGRGDEFSADDLADMLELSRRLTAFQRVLDARVDAENSIVEKE